MRCLKSIRQEVSLIKNSREVYIQLEINLISLNSIFLSLRGLLRRVRLRSINWICKILKREYKPINKVILSRELHVSTYKFLKSIVRLSIIKTFQKVTKESNRLKRPWSIKRTAIKQKMQFERRSILKWHQFLAGKCYRPRSTKNV